METERAIERLIFFTDAVTAIAITVLILPLVDIVTADAAKHESVTAFLQQNVSQLYAFALSFVIIARFWLANHEILADAIRGTTFLMWLDIAWVFTIVILPLPTEITAVYAASQLTVTIYITVCFTSTLLLTAMSFYLHKNPQLERKGKAISTAQTWGIGSTAVAFLIAFVLNALFPELHYWVLFALFLTVPLDALIKPRLRRREAARRPPDTESTPN
jgi:uncharacterized membrane protein